MTNPDINDNDVVFTGQRPSYAKYMILHKIPRSYLNILIPEVVISLLLFIGRKIEVFFGDFYEAPLVIGLVAFWILICARSWKEFLKTHQAHHYYICNFVSYILFLITSYVCFIIPNGIKTIEDIKSNLYLPLFRVALVPAILDDRDIDMAELPATLLIFYSVTLIIIIITPLFAALAHRNDYDD